MKTVKGFPKYLVSKCGCIINKKTKKQLQGIVTPKGYVRVTLRGNGTQKSKFVHRIVAENYLGNYDEELTVDHINGIKTDNRMDNLRMCTRKENVHYYLSARPSNQGSYFCNQRKKYRAYHRLKCGKILYFGQHKNKEDAIKAYKKGMKESGIIDDDCPHTVKSQPNDR